MASKYEKQLIAAGVPASYYATGYGDKITSGEYKRIMSKWQEDDAKFQATVPEALKNDPGFKGLPRDLQEIAVYSYEIQRTNNEDKARKLDQALEQAVAQADPYWKSIIRVAQDETIRSFDEAKGDFKAGQDRLNRRITELKEDLETNKGFLSLEEQSELARQEQSYVANRDKIIEGAADAGLTFSTKRAKAESDLKTYNEGIVESTKRQYAKRVSDLETEVARGNTAALAELDDLKRKMAETTTAIGRDAEIKLGSDNVPAIEGYEKLGDVAGQLYEDKAKDIDTRKQAIFNELNLNSLNV